MSGDTVEGGSSIALLASRWTIALCALIGLAVGLILFSLRTPTYESETILNVNNPIGTMADEAALLLSNDVRGPAYRVLGYDAEIDVEPNEVANLLTITVRADDPERAARAATVIAETYDQVQTSVPVSVTKAAEPNRSPVAPNRIAYILFGSALGAIAGLALGWIRALGRLAPSSAPQRDAATPIRPPRTPSPELAAAAAALRDVEVVHASAPPVAAQPMAIAVPVEEEDYSAAALAERWNPDTAFDADLVKAEPLAAPVFSPAAVDAPVAPPAVSSDAPNRRLAAPAAASQTPAPPVASPAPSPLSSPSPIPAAPAAVTPQAPRTPAMPTHDVPTHDMPTHDMPPASTPPTPTPPAPVPSIAATSAPLADRARTTSAVSGSAFSAAANSMVETPPLATNAWAPSQLELDATKAAPVAPEPTVAVAESPSGPVREIDLTDSAADDLTDLANQQAEADEPVASEYAASESVASEPAASESVASESAPVTGPAGGRIEPIDRDPGVRIDPAPMTPSRVRSGAPRGGGDRVGDLEAQVGALEQEIDSLRDHLDNARVSHLREITKERQVADRALDNARREFSRTIEASEQASRTTLASSRGELDRELADLRAGHQSELERQHREQEALLQKERERRSDELRKLGQRHDAQMADLRTEHARTLEQQKGGTRDTLAELRESVRNLTTELQAANEGEQRFRQELSMSQRTARASEQRYNENLQAVRDELTVARNDLRSEQQRNAALRRDVVKRTAEAHQAVDRTLEERSSQLADLEAMVVKQREQAERRVRDAHAAADSRARASAKREAELTARVTRLERELDQTRPQTG